jgi:hypothetical protein
MEAHASGGRYAHRSRSADTRSLGGALLGAGAISGVAAGTAMALWQMGWLDRRCCAGSWPRY